MIDISTRTFLFRVGYVRVERPFPGREKERERERRNRFMLEKRIIWKPHNSAQTKADNV
jgi:hypothetical protein